MKKLVFVTAFLMSGMAFASADCTKHPKSEWMKEEDFKKSLEKKYEIKTFRVSGNCYEIYGWEKVDGKTDKSKKVEIYFDTTTAAVVKEEKE